MFVDKIHCYEFDEYRLDITNVQLLRNDIPISITQKSFEILLFLIENQGIVLKKDELLDALWEGNFVEESTLTQHIYMLRKSLKQKGDEPNYIETVPKIGYRFVGEAKEVFYENVSPHITVNHVYPDLTESVSTSINDEIVYFKSLSESGKISAYVEEKAKHLPVQPKKQSSPQIKNYILAGILTVVGILLIGYVIYVENFFIAAPTEQNQVSQIKSIAVLPFKVIGEGEDEKLGLGIADSLISKLGKLEGISVRPTSSIIRFTENENEDLFEIGKKLNVDAILIGTIQRENDLIRINVQLYRVRDQNQLAAEKFDEKFSNIFSIQDRISERIAQNLFLKTTSKKDSLSYLEHTKNADAYQAYSMGLYHWNKRTEESFEKALGYFKIAVEKDPQFVHAYAYLADTYMLIGYYRIDLMPSDIAFAKSREMANKALELDPNCSEAITSLATIYSVEGNSEQATKLMNKALEINPNNSTARVRLAWAYVFDGNLEKSIQEMKLAQTLDPLSKTTNLALAQLYYLARQPDESMIYSRRALEIDNESIEAKRWIADAYEQKGMYKEAIHQLNEILENNKDDTYSLLYLSRIYAKEKKFDESNQFLEKALKTEGGIETSYLLALDYISLGKTDEALKFLKKYREESSGNYPHFKHDYQLDSLRDNPNFQKLLQRRQSSS